MAKDFAVLFNIEKWLKSTADMDSDVRGWYLNLLLHQYDKDGLPNDVERLAVMAGVRHSEYAKFEHVFKQVFEQKFICSPDGKLRNPVMESIMMERQNFKNSREKAGKISYILKVFRRLHGDNEEMERLIKARFDPTWDIKSEQVLEHVFTSLFEHLISISINKSSISNTKYCTEISESSEKMLNLTKVFRDNKIKTEQENIQRLVGIFATELDAKEMIKPNVKEFLSHFISWVKINHDKHKPKVRQGLQHG
jgi:hypothetical protein